MRSESGAYCFIQKGYVIEGKAVAIAIGLGGELLSTLLYLYGEQ